MQNIPIRHIKNTNHEAEFAEGFSIRSIEALLDGKEMVQDVHRHDFFLILVLIKGNGLHEIDFIPYDVNDYSIFLLRPGQVHKLILKEECKGYLIQFKTEYFFAQNKLSHQLLRKASSKNLCQLNVERFKKLDSILSYILLEYQDKQEGFNEVIKAQLGIFFIELIRHRQNTDTSNDTSSLYQQDRLEKFLGLLEDNIIKYKQVSQYADLLNLTVYQLNAIIKKSLEKNASELINEYIILEAKRNLLATSNQISQIAYDLGYEDVSYFIRFFKKHTGYSPESFRHNLS
jgi:AraC-like DNA-binding protein